MSGHHSSRKLGRLFIGLSLLACALSSVYAPSARAVMISSPVQAGTLFSPNVLLFDFNGLAPAAGDVTLSVFAAGDLVFDGNEHVNVAIGPNGGPFTNLGNFFTALGPGFSTFNCGVVCAQGTEDILLTAGSFNSLLSDIQVQLTPGSGVGNFGGSSAQVTLNYTAAAVPEPSTLALFAIGLAGLGVLMRRRGPAAVPAR